MEEIRNIFARVYAHTRDTRARLLKFNARCLLASYREPTITFDIRSFMREIRYFIALLLEFKLQCSLRPASFQ